MEKEEIDCEGSAAGGDFVTEAARKAFGVKYLYPWQRLVIANIMDAANFSGDEDDDDGAYRGRQVVLLPTGAGKSMCFLVPSLLLGGPTLVIYPLLALMADQKRRMDDGGIESVVFRGGQSDEEREENFRKIKNGAKIILANPEVLRNKSLVERLSRCGIAHAAIDEAHCVSEWGDSFRPAYLELGGIIKSLGVPIVTAFTATASPEVLSRVQEVLFGGETHIVRSESDRPNIHYHVRNACAKKIEALRLVGTMRRPMIIFCSSRHGAEDMARDINACYGDGVSRFYHAGLEKSEKSEIEKWFFDSDDGALCATCAYGMGVDKRNIRTVVHLDAPKTAEAYIQEAGRGGRDGDVADAVLIWSPADSVEFSKAAPGDRALAMKKFAEDGTCRRQILLDALGAESAVCSGCDICDERAAMARGEKVRREKTDGERALDFIARHKKQFTARALAPILAGEMNKTSMNAMGLRLWTGRDAIDMTEQLRASGKIKICGGLWKGRVTIAARRKRARSFSALPNLFRRPLLLLRRFPFSRSLFSRKARA